MQTPDVIVLDLGEPRQRLMSWFLSDSGVENLRVTSIDEALQALRSQSARVAIINSTQPNEALADVVVRMREVAPLVRIIVLHEGHHHEDEPPIDADVCIHDISEADELVEAVRAALADALPDTEPHDAAEEITRG